jgi:hypothetical protein
MLEALFDACVRGTVSPEQCAAIDDVDIAAYFELCEGDHQHTR